MIQIKKTILTLALLLTAATGAWADQLASSYSSNATLNAVTVSASMEVTIATGVTVTINNGLNITSGTLTVTGPGTLIVNGAKGTGGGNGGIDGGTGGTGGVAIGASHGQQRYTTIPSILVAVVVNLVTEGDGDQVVEGHAPAREGLVIFVLNR